VEDVTLYSSDGSPDVDWYHVVAEESTHLECGWFWELLPQCYFYFTAQLTPPDGADHEDYSMCVNASDCSGTDGTFCTEASDWSDSEGAYVMVILWEGTCWIDDSFDLYVSVEGTSDDVSSCHPYELDFSLDFTDEPCDG
jgi:hypothetical protein